MSDVRFECCGDQHDMWLHGRDDEADRWEWVDIDGRKYVRESTCRLVKITDRRRKFYGWWQCSRCGMPTFPADHGIKPLFCSQCGAKVIS